jgi:hypothetical protein
LATTVYTVEEIELQNGKSYSFRPFNLKLQRKFMNIFTNLEPPKTEDESTDQMLALATICMESVDKELAADSDAMEEALDQPTIYKLIEICAQIKLNDPNLLAAAAQAMAAAEAGQN